MPVDLSSTSGPKQPRETWESTSAALVRRYQRTFAKAAKMLPTHGLDGTNSQKDRFLTDLGDRADELHGQMLRAMRDRAASGDSRELARLCEVAIELQDIRSSHRQAVNDERLHLLTSGQEVSARLFPSAGVRVLLEHAARAMRSRMAPLTRKCWPSFWRDKQGSAAHHDMTFPEGEQDLAGSRLSKPRGRGEG